MRGLAIALLLVANLASCVLLHSQPNDATNSTRDSDQDGISDSLEAELLAEFIPTFMVSRTDCSIMPAQFAPATSKPTVIADDGTIYGQAFPRKSGAQEIELRYYHLWRKDCGELGHDLDTEHVSALIQVGKNANPAIALYWYVSAHEDTICDASHLTRAAIVGAQGHGPTVWVSRGKHASFLSEDLCVHGCGGDRCSQMEPLKVRTIVNLGEADAPMNGIAWLHSPNWPLQSKMRRSDFTDVRLARITKSPRTDVVWANPSKRPAQAAILGLNAGMGGAATGARATDTALVVTNDSTSSALDAASSKTGDALGKSSRNLWRALRKSAKNAGRFLGLNP